MKIVPPSCPVTHVERRCQRGAIFWDSLMVSSLVGFVTRPVFSVRLKAGFFIISYTSFVLYLTGLFN
jgi:hypothetical protein